MSIRVINHSDSRVTSDLDVTKNGDEVCDLAIKVEETSDVRVSIDRSERDTTVEVWVTPKEDPKDVAE